MAGSTEYSSTIATGRIFDFGANLDGYAAFSADGGEMNYYFFWGPSIPKILGRYADLTGHLQFDDDGHQRRLQIR